MIEENERAAKFMQAIQRDGEKRRTAIIQAIDKEIAAELGCTVDTVYNALNLTDPTTGEQPDRIRRMALERGGYKGTTIKWIEE